MNAKLVPYDIKINSLLESVHTVICGVEVTFNFYIASIYW